MWQHEAKCIRAAVRRHLGGRDGKEDTKLGWGRVGKWTIKVREQVSQGDLHPPPNQPWIQCRPSGLAAPVLVRIGLPMWFVKLRHTS